MIGVVDGVVVPIVVVGIFIEDEDDDVDDEVTSLKDVFERMEVVVDVVEEGIGVAFFAMPPVLL